MESRFFSKKYLWYWIGGIAIVTAVILYLILKPSPGTDKACFTITWDELNSNLGTDFGDSGKEGYVQGLSFKVEEKVPVKITAYYINKAGIENGKSSAVEVGDPDKCSLPELTIADNFYHFDKDDVGSDGRLVKFNYMRITPEESSQTPGSMVFKLEYVTDNSDGSETIVRAILTKPCPPYCPRPEL